MQNLFYVIFYTYSHYLISTVQIYDKSMRTMNFTTLYPNNTVSESFRGVVIPTARAAVLRTLCRFFSFQVFTTNQYISKKLLILYNFSLDFSDFEQ